MARNRVQFQKGLSMGDFQRRYGTEVQCHDALVRMRWPDGSPCGSGVAAAAVAILTVLLRVGSASSAGTNSIGMHRLTFGDQQVPRLFDALMFARGDGRHARRHKPIARSQLLILDD